ncbi:hypothetical protein RND81_11G123900 [Saponaria officinalis]|uniref:Zinc finger GRF-type domain-containing protein n=1 Tax=Saponaria officinalis TaxID=3572 RepID=A0AAW1HLA1_SAPOF
MSESSRNCGCNWNDGNKCFCGIPITVKKSSTPDNPGRRFEAYKLFNPVSKVGGCNYFRWFDKTQTDWQRVIDNNLNLRENIMSKELELKQQELASVKEERNRLFIEVERLKKKLKTVKDENSRLKNERSTGFWFSILVCVLICVFLVYLAMSF